MKKVLVKIRLSLSLLLITLMVCTNINFAYANNHITLYSVKASDYIASCYMNLSVTGNKELSISSTVTTVGRVDEITTAIDLQMKIGDKWITMDSWSKERSNAFTLSVDEIYSNASAGEYRFKIVYSAKVGNNKETKTAYSNITTLN